ncbi:hypothetical protein Taro_052548 [Colocasia esculenta]|uniref:Uncharacterized protein n=1 Tax=Colocasia esculenta TaxID=4460 RepID=A0A843XK09_COLES|nr:hypothetical protein [Colocasia esculenta]
MGNLHLLGLAEEGFIDKLNPLEILFQASNRGVSSLDMSLRQEVDDNLVAAKFLNFWMLDHAVKIVYGQLWRAVVGVVLRLKMTSRGVRRGVSSRPQHPRVPQYSIHHHLWITACSCKVWFRQCRHRRRLRQQYRLSYRHRLRL